MQNEDEGEWSDGQSEIAAEAKRSPKSSKKRKLSSSSSSSIMAGDTFFSKVHQEAIPFFKCDFSEVVKQADADQSKRKKVAITNYFAPKNSFN